MENIPIPFSIWTSKLWLNSHFFSHLFLFSFVRLVQFSPTLFYSGEFQSNTCQKLVFLFCIVHSKCNFRCKWWGVADSSVFSSRAVLIWELINRPMKVSPKPRSCGGLMDKVLRNQRFFFCKNWKYNEIFWQVFVSFHNQFKISIFISQVAS